MTITATDAPASRVPDVSRIKAALAHAQRVHEQSAACHEAAAAMWDAQHESERADFERRLAMLELQLAQVEADRLGIADLRSRWQTEPDPVLGAEIERRDEELTRRAERLKADDAALEQERPRLSGGRQPATERPRASAELAGARRTLGRHQEDIDLAERQAGETAKRLSLTMSRSAEALEQTAALAEAHAQRQQQSGRSKPAAQERQVALRAHSAADRARQRAQELLEFAAGRTR
jgi:hypothetical protein